MTPRLSAGSVIAIVGAESSGKSELATALAARLQQRGIAARAVGEHLREWCEREQRTPRADEQAAIAAEQTRRIASAAAVGVAVADTTALMTAVYSELLFNDCSLYADTIAAQRGYAITLLMALDLPWVPDGLQRDGPQVRAPVDALVRRALMQAGIAFSVVHGSGARRLASAWNAINAMADARFGENVPVDAGAPRWTWPCDKCSDPVCEQRLFGRLLPGHGAARPNARAAEAELELPRAPAQLAATGAAHAAELAAAPATAARAVEPDVTEPRPAAAADRPAT